MCATPVEGSPARPSFTPSESVARGPEFPLRAVVGAIKSVAPELIFVTGASTSGKSTHMRAYQQGGPGRKDLGTDDFREIRCARLIRNHCKGEYAILSQAIEDKDLYRFLNSPADFVKTHPGLYFKPANTDAEKAAREAVIKWNDTFEEYNKVLEMLKIHKPSQDAEHFEAILGHARQGLSVIFDTPNEAGFFEHLLKTPHSYRVERHLLYVPLTELIRRLPGRNAESISTGNYPNQREFLDILGQFRGLYRKAEPGEAHVGTLTREDVQKIFADNKKEIDEQNKSAAESGRGADVAEEAGYLEHFGLTAPTSEVRITTITDYSLFDKILATASQAPSGPAEPLSSHSWKAIE